MNYKQLSALDPCGDNDRFAHLQNAVPILEVLKRGTRSCAEAASVLWSSMLVYCTERLMVALDSAPVRPTLRSLIVFDCCANGENANKKTVARAPMETRCLKVVSYKLHHRVIVPTVPF